MSSTLQRLQPALLVSMSSLLACSLGDFSLDGRPCPCATGYVCEEATQTCRTGDVGVGGAGGAGVSSTGVGGEGGSAAGGAGGGTTATATPLVATFSEADGVTLSVDGSFSIAFDPDHDWQIARWYDGTDVGATSPTNLVGTPVYLLGDPQGARLCEPMQIQPQTAVATPTGWIGSRNMTVGTVETIDETPVRYRVNVDHSYANTFTLTQRTTVHASGRVDVESILYTSGLEVLQWAEAHYTTMPTGSTWASLERQDLIARFTHPASTASLLLVARPPAGRWAGLDGPNNAYMDLVPPDFVLDNTAPLIARGVLALRPFGAGSPGALAYGIDLLNPSIVVDDGELSGDGFDETTGTYVIQAGSAGSARFRLASDQARHAPTIEVLGFDAETWVLRRDGSVVASSEDAVDGKVIGDRTLVRQLPVGPNGPVDNPARLLIHHQGVLEQKVGGHVYLLETQ